jgi:hypothetical protein
MIIDKICQGLKTSEQRVTAIINDTCLGFQRAEKAFIEKLLENVNEEIDRFNSSNDEINLIGRRDIIGEVYFKDWPEWTAYRKYIYSNSIDAFHEINSFIRKSVLKYGFPEESIFCCYDEQRGFRFIICSFGETSLGKNNESYENLI